MLLHIVRAYPRCLSEARFSRAGGWLLLALFLTGCSTPTQPVASTNHTLRDVPGLPFTLLSQGFKPSEWDRLASLRYTGYVILAGRVDESGSIPSPRVLKAYPDSSRNDLAVEFSGDIQVVATTIGSHVPPTAKVFVVFYETPPIRTALVFGEADATIAPTGVTGGARQLLIKSY